MSFSSVRVVLRNSRLWLSLWLLRTVTFVWRPSTSLRSPSNSESLSHSTIPIVCTSLFNTLQDICTQGEVGQWEEQLKFSGNLLKPILNKVIELRAKVSNLDQCRTSTTQSISTPSLQSHSIPTSTVQITMDFSDELQRCSSWLSKVQTLSLTFTLRTVTFFWSSITSMRSPSNFKSISQSTYSLVFTSLMNISSDNSTEGDVCQREEQLKFSGNLLMPIISKFIEIKAKVSNLSSCRTSTTQSISSPSLQLNSYQTSTVQNTRNFSD